MLTISKYIGHHILNLKDKLRGIAFFLILLSVCCSSIHLAFAGTAAPVSIIPANPPVDLINGWYYQWGDSPVDSLGVPVWTSSGVDNTNWQPKLNREGERNFHSNRTIWLKKTLPDKHWTEPALYYRSLEQSIDVYLENRHIYSYSKLDSLGGSLSLGSPWHIIPLPPDYEGKTVYIRLHSPSVIYVSIFRELLLGSQEDLLLKKSASILNILRGDLDYIILSGLFIFIGFTIIFLYFIKRNKQSASLHLAFATVCLGLWIIAESDIRSLIFDVPIIWIYTAYASIQLVPIGFCSFVYKVFHMKNKRLLKCIRYLYMVYTPITFILDLNGVISLMYSIKIFHIIVILTMAIILQDIIRLARKGDFNARVFSLGFSILALSSIYDIIDRFYISIPLLQGHHVIPWAMFIFILTLVYIMERYYVEIQDKLQLYSMEIKAKDEKILESKKLLNHALEYDKLKNEFIANISHELRTPLSIILGTLQLFKIYLNNGLIVDSKENIHGYIKSMQQNCYRLLKLVNNVIDITKIDSGYLHPSFVNCNIIHIVKDITYSVSDYIKSKGIKVQFSSNVEEKIMACDPDKLERILLNLLSNAVKFTKPGGTITVNVCVNESNLLITVCDTGIGIPRDKLDIIFERFRQVDKTMTRSHEGSGIGLSIVKSLVEMHGGSIIAQSVLGNGTKFIIDLPITTLPEETENLVLTNITSNSGVEKINIEFSDIYS